MFVLLLAVVFGAFTLAVPEVAEAKGKRPTREMIEQAEALAAEGWQLWRKQDLTTAAKKFEESVELNPKDANAWNGYGWALFNSGQSTKALRAFERCVKLSPRHPAGLNGLGQLYLSRGEYKQAEKYLKKSAKSPQASAAWYGLARVYLLTGEYKKALPWVKKSATAGSSNDISKQMLTAAKAGELSDELRQMLEPLAARENDRSKDKGEALAPSKDVVECLEQFRRAAICYDLSFDQILDKHLAPYDESRMELFPGKDAWPNGLMLSSIRAYAKKGFRTLENADDYQSEQPGIIAFGEPLNQNINCEQYQMLVLLKGIGKGGSVLIDSYVSVLCQGDMAGIINSQSYSTNIIRGNAAGRMRNASYGHWIVFGDFSGKFDFESGGTLRILGDFTGEIKLSSGEYKRRGKIFLAGKTTEKELRQIQGTGTVYLEESDLKNGLHEVGQLTVIVGEL